MLGGMVEIYLSVMVAGKVIKIDVRNGVRDNAQKCLAVWLRFICQKWLPERLSRLMSGMYDDMLEIFRAGMVAEKVCRNAWLNA